MQQENCSVCFRSFSSTVVPLVTPCGHSFCAACSSMVRSCPLCRHRLSATAQCPTNVSLLSLIEKLERSQQDQLSNPDSDRREPALSATATASQTQGLSFLAGKSMTLNFRKLESRH